MRSNVLVVLALMTAPALVLSQNLPRPEVGIRSGIIRRTASGSSASTTAIVVPDGLFGSGGGLHYLFFLSPRFGLEPQFGLIRMSSDGSTFSVKSYGVQGSIFLGPDATRAPYAFAILRLLQSDDSGGGFSSSQSMTGFGGGFGYRRVYRESVAVRYEARLVKSSGDGEESTELAFLVGLGAVIRK